MMRAAALAALLVQSPADARPMRMLDEWIAAVERHAAGEEDSALAAMALWNLDDLERMQGYVEAVAGVPPSTAARAARRRVISRAALADIRERTETLQLRGGLDAFRKRAVILHTDLAMVGSQPVRIDVPNSPSQRPQRRDHPNLPVDVKTFDGQVAHFEVANPHWEYARALLEALPQSPRRDPIVAQWYRAIGAWYAKQDNAADATRHFEQAQRMVPDDPGVLYGAACLQETLGSPKVQNFVRITKLPNGMVLLGVVAAQTHFRRAETLLRRALAGQPDFTEARLRLGRVLAGRREYSAALTELHAALLELKEPALVYYAHLFSGDAALALGRHADAQVSYQRALEGYPNAQAARLGLAAALRLSGHRAQALDAMMTTLNVPHGSRDSQDEPWWDYYAGDAANVDRLIAELRAPFRRPAP